MLYDVLKARPGWKAMDGYDVSPERRESPGIA